MTDRDDGFRVEIRPRQWLTGLAVTGPFDVAEARTVDAWETLAAMVETMPAPLNRDEWLSACHIRETELTCYVGMTSAAPVTDVSPDLLTIEIPRHEYLVANHAGDREELGNLYAAMFARVQRSDRRINREILWLERFSGPYRRGEPLNMEIWLPLRDQGGLP